MTKRRPIQKSQTLGRRRYRSVCALLMPGILLGLLVCPRVEAHIQDQFESVHFRSSVPDFGIPPRRANMTWWGEQDDRPRTQYGMLGERGDMELSEEGAEKRQDARMRLRSKLLAEARRAEEAGRWEVARRLYERIGKTIRWHDTDRDRVEVLRQVEKMPRPLAPSFLAALQFYLHGVASLDKEEAAIADSTFRSVYADHAASWLQEHALYQRATIAYAGEDYPHAVTLYQRLLRDFPHTSRREAALMMTARGEILPITPENDRLAAGQQALDQLWKEFPRTRFYRSILGLKARIHYLKGRYSSALWCYFTLGDLESVEIVAKSLPPAEQSRVKVRLLGGYLQRMVAANTYWDYAHALLAVKKTRANFSPDESHQFLNLLLHDGSLSAPYFYYRLYHCDNTPHDLKNLADLADRIATGNPAMRLPPLVQARLAEVYYQQHAYPKALTWADRALASDPSLDRALWMHGAAAHRLQRYTTALQDFRTLLERCPHSQLRHGAREEIAILCERTGDLEGALDQYLALNYGADVAYLLDARMTIPQVEHFYRSRPGTERPRLYYYYYGMIGGDYDEKKRPPSVTLRQLLTYTLGIRYLREERWKEAAYRLTQIPHKLRVKMDAGRRDYAGRSSPNALTAVEDLSRLQRAIAQTHSDEARATAMYRYASYYYTHGTLLLYNPLLWSHERHDNFGFFWNTTLESKADRQAIVAYMYRHEVYARVRELCLQIATRYPRTSVAPKALYRAACASHYLAYFNAWWRNTDEKVHHHADEASRLMREVARRYPRNPLAKEAQKYAGVFQQEKKEFAW